MGILKQGAVFLGISALLAGCSGSGEDVRISFCRDMMNRHLGQTEWTGADYRAKEPEYAQITLTHAGGSVSCYYNYNDIEGSLQTASDPLASYATTPYKVSVDGRQLSTEEMDRLVVASSKAQVKAVAEGIKQGVTGAVEKVGESLSRE